MKTLSLRARAVARVAIAAGVLLFCIAADCAVLAFELGRQTGAAVHARNDQLARVARRVLAPPEPVVPEPVVPEPVAHRKGEHVRTTRHWLAVDAGSEAVISEHATEAEATEACRAYRLSHPSRCPRVQEDWCYVFVPAPAPRDWASLTVRELRSITGARSKRLRKADLVALAANMAA